MRPIARKLGGTMRRLTVQELVRELRHVIYEAGRVRELALGTLRTSAHAMTRRDAGRERDAANRRIRAMQQLERELTGRRRA